MLSMMLSKDRAKPFVRDKHRHKYRHRYRLLKQTEDRKHREKNVDNSNLDLLVFNQLQGEVLLFLSLT